MFNRLKAAEKVSRFMSLNGSFFEKKEVTRAKSQSAGKTV